MVEFDHRGVRWGLGHSNNGYSLSSEEILHMLVYILEIIIKGEKIGRGVSRHESPTYTLIRKGERHVACWVTVSAKFLNF